MIPIILLAAGLLAQQEGKKQSIRAQKREQRDEAQRQLGFQQDASKQLHTEMDAYNADNRIRQDSAAEGRLRDTSNASDKDALRLFEGSSDGSAGSRATAEAVGASAGRRGAAFAGLNGGRIGQNERRRLGLDIGANIAGIRQRSQRSLGMFPERLEAASKHGQGLMTVGSLMASYGYGGTGDMLTGLAQQQVQDGSSGGYGGRRRQPYDESSPGATDLWGDSDPNLQQS